MSKKIGLYLLFFAFLGYAISGGAASGYAAQSAIAASGGAASGGATSGGAILGVWMDRMKDAEIRIYGCGGKYCGRIVWTKGGPKTDINNPEAALRSRRILGLRIMEGFSFAGKNRWTGGRLYDPKSGNTYTGRIVLISPDRLRLRGYVLIPLFGRTTVWSRASGP
ncbi:MAG: DUF2147 domain-containing protein [Nitrospiraceae bacterium]|nr:DUF2147 domain-containing protein [Nitrospiraceae bacterium]